MQELYDTEIPAKKAFLVAIRGSRTAATEAESLARELEGLAATLGLDIVGREFVHIREKHGKYGMGTGKAEEIAGKAAEAGADCLVFDGELSPSQQRNWEQLAGISAVDRQELIIQIFAGRARTKEAELQVELAELYYALPRLSHKYIDLSRQRGGRYGTKGSGETRLETDRRLVEQRIHRLKEELEEVRKHRAVQRKKRDKAAFSCALVGYTNAGKSSLLNSLTGAEVLTEDKLFATLDATSRVLDRKGHTLVLTDTVGFIRRLPHALIDAFRSTLEEAAQADLLVIVLDAADPDVDRYYETTLAVLHELGADKKSMITVLNKVDRLNETEHPGILDSLLKRYPGSIPVSALTRTGLEELIEQIEHTLSGSSVLFRFPPERPDLAALLHREAQVLSEIYEGTYIELQARVDAALAKRLKGYVVETGKGNQDGNDQERLQRADSDHFTV
jgi:GTP-binding protein HflX